MIFGFAVYYEDICEIVGDISYFKIHKNPVEVDQIKANYSNNFTYTEWFGYIKLLSSLNTPIKDKEYKLP